MYNLTNKLFTLYPRKSIRLFEIILPLASIMLISVPFWGSLVFPTQLAYFIIFFDVYWLYKSLDLAISSFFAAKKIKEAENIDWLKKCEKLPHFDTIRHLLILPTYKESLSKLSETLDSIASQTLPLNKLYVVVGFEEREEEANEKAKVLKEKYASVFGGLYTTIHPDLPNEVKGKSSNQAYAAREVFKILIEPKKIDVDYLTISSVDADSIFDPQYFSYLSYSFLTSINPYIAFWQSANVHYNNFWQVPSFTRIITFFGNLWRTSLLVQGLRLIPNSTYSLSFRLLRDIGYWDTDVIPEDYRVFFKAFFALKGKVHVEPIYLKTSMDSAHAHGYWKSLVNKYNQERRWSWGISDDALYLKWYFTVRGVPFFKKTYILTNVVLDHILWPVNWFIITISANLIVLINPVFSRTTLGYNLPRLSGFILTLCLYALFVLIFIDFNLRPSNYSRTKKSRQFLFPLEFILMPIAGFFLSSLPALISHVQLIIGKRLEYKVTEKV